jgi:hypothetical protein
VRRNRDADEDRDQGAADRAAARRGGVAVPLHEHHPTAARAGPRLDVRAGTEDAGARRDGPPGAHRRDLVGRQRGPDQRGVGIDRAGGREAAEAHVDGRQGALGALRGTRRVGAVRRRVGEPGQRVPCRGALGVADQAHGQQTGQQPGHHRDRDAECGDAGGQAAAAPVHPPSRSTA